MGLYMGLLIFCNNNLIVQIRSALLYFALRYSSQYAKNLWSHGVGIKNKTLKKPVFMRLFGGLLFACGLNVGLFLYFLMFLKVSRALSFSSDASICCLLGYKCEYVFSVVSMFSWPRRSEINKISIPISTHNDACE